MSDLIEIKPDWELLSDFKSLQPFLFEHPDLCKITNDKYTNMLNLLRVNRLAKYINEFCFLIKSVQLVELFTEPEKKSQEINRKRNKDLKRLNDLFSDNLPSKGIDKVKIQFKNTAKKSLILENLLNEYVLEFLQEKEAEFRAYNKIRFDEINHAPKEPYKDTLKYIPEIDRFLMKRIEKDLSQNERIEIIEKVFELANFDFSKVRTRKHSTDYIRNILNTTSKEI